MTNFGKIPQFIKNWGIFLLLFFLNQPLIFAQLEDSYWPFTKNYAIKWINQDTFKVDTCGFKGIELEGVSSICNRYGNLLFYSDGLNLFNSKHEIIDSTFNGCILGQNGWVCTVNQGTLFLNSVENTNQIHFFTNNRSNIEYALLDTSGEIIKKNKFLTTVNSEALNSVRHANGRDWWIFFHENDLYKIYLLNNDSLINFKQFRVGSNHINQYVGNLAISKSGDKVLKISNASLENQRCILDFFKFRRNIGELLLIKDYSYLLPGVSDLFSATLSENGNIAYMYSYNGNLLIMINFQTEYYFQKFILVGSNLKTYNKKIFTTTDPIITFDTIANINVILNSNLDTFTNINILYNYLKYKDNKVYSTSLPNHPNYQLGPDLHPGFFYAATCHQITVTDTSWGHFYRVWDWGDGSPKDTFAVVQHAEYLPGLLDTFKTVSHTYSQSGTYTVTLQILNPYTPYKLPPGEFLKDTVFQTVVIPDCIYPQTILSDSAICPGKALEIKYSGSKNYQSLTMFYGDGSSETKSYPDSIFSHSYSNSGTYHLFLQASNADHDTLHPVGKIEVLECPDYLYVYPNPVTENLTINYKQSTDFELVLLNSIGQEVWTAEVKAGEATLYFDLPVAAGVYVLRAQNHDKELKKMKLVKLE